MIASKPVVTMCQAAAFFGLIAGIIVGIICTLAVVAMLNSAQDGGAKSMDVLFRINGEEWMCTEQ